MRSAFSLSTDNIFSGGYMNFLTDSPKKLYGKFLSASVFSALVVSVYAFVDTIAVGQSEGPLGTAAMAVITPLYGLFNFFSILCGIGGSVQMSRARGEGKTEKGNAYFTSSLILMTAIAAVFWIILIFFHKYIFTFFGANEELMPKVMSYAKWMLMFFPAFISPAFLGALIRNDGAPNLVMTAVITGGCTNIFGDWFFVFPLGMGMEGAAVATVLGILVQIFIMCTHFFRKRCTLKLVKPYSLLKAAGNILKVGFGSGIIELGTVITAVLMNNQIMKHGTTAHLAVYGVIVTIFQLFSAIFSGVGQAIQPIVSSNYGAGNHGRNREFLKMSLVTVLCFGVLFTAIGELLPVQITKLFIKATPEVIAAAPIIFRLFFPLFIPSGISVLAIYYLQSTMGHKMAMTVSVLKGIVLSGIFIILFPVFWGINGVWTAMPCAELLTAAAALYFIKSREKQITLNS